MNAVMRLRMIQVGCILMVLGCIMDARLHSRTDQASLSLLNGNCAALFFYCASPPAAREIFPTP
jgi:hypothetical protein